MKARNKEELTEKYNEYVKKVTKTISLPKNMFWAFIVGGSICTVGQIVMEYLKYKNMNENEVSSITSIILIFLSALLTGLNIYSKIGKVGGAGALVPITGFANSVAAPAIEFKSEGWVMGLGCKIFTIAGPVILYGILTSSLCGLIYWII